MTANKDLVKLTLSNAAQCRALRLRRHEPLQSVILKIDLDSIEQRVSDALKKGPNNENINNHTFNPRTGRIRSTR